MAALVNTGTVVAPGEVLYAEAVELGARVAAEAVVPGPGTYARLVETASGSGAERHVVALRLGVAQWDGAMISVYTAGITSKSAKTEAHTSLLDMEEEGNSPAVTTSRTVFGPRPGDLVHMRVTRLTRLGAGGEIVAINGVWCAGSGTLGRQEAFRGVIRQEDIRPFKPTKDQLQAPPPSQAFQAGDVVVAEVISQSDVRQYQLSTLAPRCGVVESVVTTGSYGEGTRRRLEHIPGRRDAMVCPVSGAVLPRWTPLLEL